MELSTLSSRCEELSRQWGVQIIGEAHPEWGSDQPDHRQKIRQHLTSLGFASAFDLKHDSYAKDEFDFKKYPDGAISISHAPGLGGFAAVRTARSQAAKFEATGFKAGGAVQVGLDIENASRLSLPVVKRICPHEQSQVKQECRDLAPLFAGDLDQSPLLMAWLAAIWVAKESAFKSLRGPQQPKTISQVVLTEWKPGANQDFSFKFSSAIPLKQIDSSALSLGSGLAWVDGAHAVALSLLR